MTFENIFIADPGNLLPLDEDAQVAVFGLPTDENLEKYISIFSMMAQAFTGDLDFGFLDSEIIDSDIEMIKNSIIKAEIVFFILLAEEKFSFEEKLISKFQTIIEYLSSRRKNVFISNHPESEQLFRMNINITLKDSSEHSLAGVIINLLGKDKAELFTS